MLTKYDSLLNFYPPVWKFLLCFVCSDWFSILLVSPPLFFLVTRPNCSKTYFSFTCQAHWKNHLIFAGPLGKLSRICWPGQARRMTAHLFILYRIKYYFHFLIQNYTFILGENLKLVINISFFFNIFFLNTLINSSNNHSSRNMPSPPFFFP